MKSTNLHFSAIILVAFNPRTTAALILAARYFNNQEYKSVAEQLSTYYY